jgi:hypothetical protein
MVMPILEGLIVSVAGNFINKKATEKPLSYTEKLYQGGTRTFEHTCGAIAIGASEWVNLLNGDIPAARFYLPLDSITVMNNSAEPITLYLNSVADAITIPPYMVKPIARKSFRSVGVLNAGVAGINAGEVIFQMKKLPPNVQVVNIGGGA